MQSHSFAEQFVESPLIIFLHSPSLCSCISLHYMLRLRLLCSFCFSAVVVFPFFSLTSPRRKGNFLFYLDVHSIEWKGNFANKKPNFAKQTSGYCSKPLSFTLYQQDVRHSHSRPLQFALLKTTFGPVFPNFCPNNSPPKGLACHSHLSSLQWFPSHLLPGIELCPQLEEPFFLQMYSSPRVLPRPSHHSWGRPKGFQQNPLIAQFWIFSSLHLTFMLLLWRYHCYDYYIWQMQQIFERLTIWESVNFCHPGSSIRRRWSRALVEWRRACGEW